MKTKNALEILSQRAKKNPKLQAAYLAEKKRYVIACKIREGRKRANLTQKKLAELIGTTQSAIARLESTDYEGYSIQMLKKIADALGEPLENLLGEKKEYAPLIPLYSASIMKHATSFINWTQSQVVKRPYAK